MEKKWWARIITNHRDDYGSLIPTGCTDKEAARDYLKTYYGASYVKEWVLL